MNDLNTVQKVAAVISALVIPLGAVGGGALWMAEHVAQANDDSAEQEQMVEALEKLTDLHVRQQTVEDAERAQLRKLCAAGKLQDEDCTEAER